MKVPFNKLNEDLKNKIVEEYYVKKDLSFKDLSYYLNVSERALSRVLKEAGINTKRINRYRINEEYFQTIDNQEKAYILGLLYADGYVGDNHFNNIVLGMKDKDIIYKVANLLEYDGEIRLGNKGGFENSGVNYILSISSEKMASDLRKLGLYPNKSTSMVEIPQLDTELYRHFIRGYFDGDGSILHSKTTSYHMVAGEKKKYEYDKVNFCILGTNSFIMQIVNILNLKYYSIRKTKCNEIIEIRVCSNKEIKKLFKYFYDESTIYLERKFVKWQGFMSAYVK
jgi:DNA-binding transcriptional regulator WhiA